jgi:hypothetical protein
MLRHNYEKKRQKVSMKNIFKLVEDGDLNAFKLQENCDLNNDRDDNGNTYLHR